MLRGSLPQDRPLKERLLRGISRSATAVPVAKSSTRTQYKQYDESKLLQAYQDVIQSKLPVRRAALVYGVPLSTLSDHVTGKVQFGKKGGPEKHLKDNEELELKNFISGMAVIGYGYGRKEIIGLVQEIVDKKDHEKKKTVTHGWWNGYRKRHPDIVLRNPEPLSSVRHMACNPEVLRSYFEELESILVENDLIHQPSQIFNMDETGFPLNPKSTFIACKRGEKHPSFVSSGASTHITVLACCSASGYSMLPLIIFEGKVLKQELADGEVPGTMYALSSSGWVDSEIFDLWFTHHFLPHAPGVRPLLLLLDGHSSHLNPTTITRAAEEKVIIFCLPPHTTHRTQPLDKGCFSPLKAYWRDECHAYIRKNPGKVITKFQFNNIFSKAWMRGMSIGNITSGFKTTGIYPFNPKKLLPQEEQPSPFRQLGKRTGIKYIPFSTATPRRRVPEFPTRISPIPESPFPESPIPESPIPESPIPELPIPESPITESPILAKSQTQKFANRLSLDDFSINYGKNSFTAEEVARYQRRYEEGYDIPDSRYQRWLRYKESTPFEDDSAYVLPYKSSLSILLSSQSKVPEIKVPAKPSSTIRVLTSAQYRKILEEKRKKKEEDRMLKEQRKKIMEEKRRKKEEEKMQRRKIMEEKRKKKEEEKILKEQQKQERDQRKAEKGGKQSAAQKKSSGEY